VDIATVVECACVCSGKLVIELQDGRHAGSVRRALLRAVCLR